MSTGRARPATLRRGLVLLGLAALAVGLFPAAAPASWMIPGYPYRAKDFAILKRGSHYHVFYTRTNTLDPNGASELSFGHAWSQDLYHWTQLDTVLSVRPDNWDNRHVWAPTIVEVDGVYYMFYTGVTDIPGVIALHQRIGVATSTDLFTWNRLDVPVYACEQVPWTFCDSTRAIAGNFRDPFVMPDPVTPGRWLMYYATVARSDSNRYVDGLAASNGDFTQWSDVKEMLVTDRSTTGWDLAESPHLYLHDGLWYLFFTTNATEPLVWATGPDPTGDPPSWTYHGSLGPMLGFSTRFWFASEAFGEGTHDYYAFVNFDRVDVREFLWNADGTFALAQPSQTHVLSMTWSRDSVGQGDNDTLLVKTVNPGNVWAHFELMRIDSLTGAGLPTPPGSLGLPDSLRLTDTLVVYNWSALRYTDSTGTEGHTRFVLRLTDRTASADTVFVGAPGTCGVGGGDSGGGEILDPAHLAALARLGPQLRTLTRTPLSDAPALLVELPWAMDARVEVFDLQGRRVTVLADGLLPKGATVLPWTGAGANGVYFARLRTPDATRWSRVVRLR